MKDCQAYFNLKLPSELLSRRYEKFLLIMSLKIFIHHNIYCCALVLNFDFMLLVILLHGFCYYSALFN